ncbi:MAG TPA: hypothetical protein DDW50_19600 [Firmicutes bacterium]|jgi:hypothetical protein|nr:hypothetical protein [Bacillota bacterium]
MITDNPIQKNPLSEVAQQLISDIRTVSEGECWRTFTEIDQNMQHHRMRIRYSVRELIPDNSNMESTSTEV